VEPKEYRAGDGSASAWARVKKIFLEVCDLEPEIRWQRLEELCGNDPKLRREVERWLKHDLLDSIFDSPASSAGQAVGEAGQAVVEHESASWGATAEILDPWIGRTVQSYKLLALVGRGGMGVVYRAEDVRLKRSVAVKFLNRRFLRDDRQKKRFLREAQAAAALDHPSICPVYDVGEIEGRPYIVTAFIAGDNLAKAIPPSGFSAGTALDHAIQIAEGLHAAHQQGIVHRDMKPGNVILAASAEGELRAKIIDFGLSQIGGTSELTEPGQLIGTAAYIAPEILQGKVVDQRGDIWSLGVMLYEMLSGYPPFDAENRERLFYVICHEEAEPLTAVRPNLPEDAARIVAKALEKDRDRRYGSVRDFLDDLRRLKRRVSRGEIALSGPEKALSTRISVPAAAETSTAAAPTPATSSKQTRRWMFLVAAGAAVTVAAVVGFGLLGRKDAVNPPPEVKRLTFDSGLALHPAVSPDGKYLAFASDRAGEGNLDIWVQALPGGEPVCLTKDAANEDFPSFSPDGTEIAFQSDREGPGIYSIPVLGGEPRLLAQKGSQPRYSPDGQRLSFTLPDPGSGQQSLTTAVFLMPAEGGERTELLTGSFSSYPIWSPDSSRLLYAGFTSPQSDSEAIFPLDDVVLGSGAWYIAPVSGGQPVRIELSAQFRNFLPAFPIPLAWLGDNQILFSAASGDEVNLWLATFSPSNRRIAGPLQQLTFGTGRITEASVAGSGAVVFAITAARSRLWDLSLKTSETKNKGDLMAVVTNRDFTYWPSLSDTGKLAYFSRTFDKLNLWLRDLPSGKETLLASVEGNINLVSAYIDRAGTRVAYTALRESKPVIYTIGTGGGTPERICEDCGQLRSWSPERRIMLSQEHVFEGSNLVAERIDRIDVGGRKTVLFQKPGFFLFSPDLSPDGDWVAFQARPSLGDRSEQLFLAPMSDGAPVEPDRWIAVTELKYFDANPVFSRDGKILFFNSDRDGFTCLWAVRLHPASRKPSGDPFPVQHFHGNPRYYSQYPVFGVGPDRIVISLEQVQSDLWMIKLPE
jgi:eukaryotic-like serine/threonine-protein kinase